MFKREGTTRWKCRVCGYVYEAEGAPAKCPLFKVEKAHFEIKEMNY